MTQCNRHECSDRREDDGGIQFFGRRLVRSASPGSTETLRKFLGLGIAGAGEDKNFTSIKNCDMRDDMGSEAEPVKAMPLGITTLEQRVKPNHARNRQR